MTGLVKNISDWYAGLPKITRKAVTASFLGSFFLVIIWAKFFFYEHGALIGFGASAMASLISFIAVIIAGGTGIIGGLIQIAFIPPRRTGLISIAVGFLPLLMYLLIMFYLQNVNGLDFD